MEHIRVLIVDWLPVDAHGLTAYYFEDGQAFFTIFINGRLSIDMQKTAYSHEIGHINRRDFHSIYSLDELEFLAHDLAS